MAKTDKISGKRSASAGISCYVSPLTIEEFYMWKISKYWNRLAYMIADIGRMMIWDYKGKNSDILGDDFYSKTTREIMTRCK